MIVRLRRFLLRPDVRRRPLRFLARRARIELERRFRPAALWREREVELDDGLVIRVWPADTIGRSIYVHGVHEFLSVEAFKALLEPGMTVVDAGAHVGQFTLIAARRVGAYGRVLAFEPSPALHERLVDNVRANGLGNVTALARALADENGDVRLRLPADPSNSGLASVVADDGSGDGATIAVRAVRLDDVLVAEGVTRVDVLKVDVEGAEAAVFRGADETLRVARPSVLFEVGDVARDGRSAAADALRALGYELYGLRARAAAPHWDLVRLCPGEDPRPFAEPWCALNLLALHPERGHALARLPFAPDS